MHGIVLIGTVGAITVTAAVAILGLIILAKVHRRMGEMTTTLNAMKYDIIRLGATPEATSTPRPEQRGRRRGHLLLIPGGATAVAAVSAAWASARRHPVLAVGAATAALATAALLQPGLTTESRPSPGPAPEAAPIITTAPPAPTTPPPDDETDLEDEDQVEADPSPTGTPPAVTPVDEERPPAAEPSSDTAPAPAAEGQQPEPDSEPTEPPGEPEPTTPATPEPTPPPTGAPENPEDEEVPDDIGRGGLCLNLGIPPLLELDLCLI